MDPCLTQEIPVTLPAWRKYSAAPTISNYKAVTSLTPILEKLLGALPESEGQLNSDELFARVTPFQGTGPCVVETVGRKKRKAFCKVTHLIDPVRKLQAYYEDPVKGERRYNSKLSNPENQAYIDCMANYLLGQLRERKVSPHFCLFYGGFKGVADTYRYNITEYYSSYRKYRVFWDRKRKGLFSLHMDISEAGSALNTPTSTLSDTSFTYSTGQSAASSRTHVTLASAGLKIEEADLETVNSFPSVKSGSTSTSEDGSEDSSEDTGSEDSDESVAIYSEFKDFPVMLIFQEEMDGVMDNLLEDPDETDPETHDRWIAWTFQVIAALCAAQGVLGLTHNDLHTNNIVYSNTDIPWLWYKMRDGTTWRIPTFGRIFRIIDFGRAVFRVSKQWFISDDFCPGGDANGQYMFDSLQKNPSDRNIYPNPSFDLCRFSVSIIDALFPSMPAKKEGGGILNEENGTIIYETESPLWNLLWSWLIDDKGYNVLREEDGSERFPDFDLYQHIAAHVFCAKPQEQLRKEIFKQYRVDKDSVGDWETVYPLFC